MGKPGSGKSFAIAKLDPNKTFIFNSDMKRLPFRGASKLYQTFYIKGTTQVDYLKSNYLETESRPVIEAGLKYISTKRPEINVVVIDTLTHVQISHMLARSREQNWDKFYDFVADVWDTVKNATKLREDLVIFFNAHTEETESLGNITRKMKAPVGKLLKEKIEPEGLFTIVFETSVTVSDDGTTREYKFLTQNDGSNTAKSPQGMFDLYIDNDFDTISKQIRAYYNDEEPVMQVTSENVQKNIPKQLINPSAVNF